VIELMLEAERALAVGLLDRADQLYGRVASADPKNSIAIVGLARVALERGDQRGAYVHARRALALDPDNPMASHLARRMAEQMEGRGEPLPELGVAGSPASAAPAATPGTAPLPTDAGTPPERGGLVGRILRRRRQ
jgi:predicted Zn-dependent protease